MMKLRISALAFLLILPAAATAQDANNPSPTTATTAESLRERLMPAGVAALVTAPAAMVEKTETKETTPAPTVVVARRSSGVGLMIAGGALFVAGLLVDDDDAGTVLVLAGAGIGAYGLYLYFR